MLYMVSVSGLHSNMTMRQVGVYVKMFTTTRINYTVYVNMNTLITGEKRYSIIITLTGNYILQRFTNIHTNKTRDNRFFLKIMIKQISSILKDMNPITLDEMQNIRLMDRIDSKYVASVSLLPDLLRKMIPLYKVQEIEGERFAAYSTQYFDTPELGMFVMHQNGKLNRQKIRIRSYLNSNLSFLEVKNKNNKGRTSKKRVPVEVSQLASIDELNDEKDFLKRYSLFDIEHLHPSLTNKFDRITFVNNKETERITIDINLSFRNCITEKDARIDDLMILELKQDGWKRSEFRDILNELRIKQTSFSKYCIGTVLTNPDSKYNRFKEKTEIINKLI